MQVLATLISGLMFGCGLVVSGLINPAKVLNFLDLAGTWDPSLAITMAVAVVTTAIGYRLAFERGRPLLDSSFHVPAANAIDGKLLVGAGLFGIGWGLAGFCPGPAIAALPVGSSPALTFFVAMLAGMAVARGVASSPNLTGVMR